MKWAFPSGVITAAAMALTTAVFGSAATGQERRIAPAESVTVTGCVMKEEDYREAHRLPSRPLGVGGDYILANAATTSPSVFTSPGAGTSTPAATGTTGSVAAPNVAFELTGTKEKQVEPYVGKRVEIVGTLKAAEVGPSGPTGGASAAATPDLKLRELDVTTVKELTGACPP